ncbi:hypothetical protein HHI36_002883 [Cryptolaemus montrouzieri]|uniref:DNA polymerase alpha subunit B n=1 Tax=Cryptolaemus montrouzieri TaxID=559131 RepID=A0ABD2PBU2_9CUCU
MNLKDELVISFQFMNMVLDSKVLMKCEELCVSYNIEPEEFVNVWCAYAALNMYADAPTLEQLDVMEKKKLSKYNKDKSFNKTPVRTPKRTRNENVIQTPQKQLDVEKNSHNDTVPPNSNVPQNHTDLSEPVSEPEVLDISISKHLSSTQETTKYAERTNALSVRVSIGREDDFTINKNKQVCVKHFNENDFLGTEAKYMYEVLGQQACSISNITNEVGNAIIKKNNLTLSNDKSTKNYIGPIITYGRIFVDGKGHLNLQSIMLEGSMQLNGGHCVNLNVDKVPKVALFPGQVVAVKGKMLSGNKLIAESIYSDVGLNLPLEPPVIEDHLRIIVATGPYTLNENFNYDPMRDLLNYVVDHQPHVLILMGPFVDLNHPLLYVDMPERFDVFFENLIESISAALQDTPIEIVIISSIKEAHHQNIYPTPPYKTREKHQNIKFFPDPCVLKIDGLVLAATTVDSMYHIAKEELVTDTKSDTMSRLASHLIQQHSFYPIYPHSELNVSDQLLESHGIMDCLPHLLILPSTFRGFIRNINECVVLNPERLTRSNGGGAFADITISPGVTPSITNRISCKILNI